MRVLVAEDDPVTRRVLSTLLSGWGYEVAAVATGADAWEVLRGDDAPRLALLNWEMPGMDGVEICRRLRRLPSDAYTYVLLLTGREGSDDLLEGLDAGADDYVTTPFDKAELEGRLRVGRRITTLHEQLLLAREDMRHQATHDALTGVLNRAGVLDGLAIEVAEMSRRGGGLGVVMADIDHFKRINDTWGHAAGDAVLREVGRRVATTLRPYDRLGRVGGEEFLLVLPGDDPSAPQAVAERVRERIAGEPLLFGDALVVVTCSLGIAWTDQAEVAGELVRRADEALYRAKRQGRNRVCG